MNLAYIIRVSILAFSLRNKIGKLGIGEMIRTAFISLICALVALLAISILPNDQMLSFLISLFLFFVLYFGLCSLVMKSEIKTMWRLLSQSFANQSAGMWGPTWLFIVEKDKYLGPIVDYDPKLQIEKCGVNTFSPYCSAQGVRDAGFSHFIFRSWTT